MLLTDYIKLTQPERIRVANEEALVTGLPATKVFDWLEKACSNSKKSVAASA